MFLTLGELGDLEEAMRSVQESFQEMVGAMREQSLGLERSVDDVTGVSDQLARDAHQALALTSEMAAAGEELSATMAQLDSQSSETREQVHEVAESLDRIASGFAEVRRAAEDSASKVQGASELA